MKFLSTMPKAKLQKMLLVVLLFCGGAFILAYLVVGKQYSEWAQRSEKIAKLTADLEREEKGSQRVVLDGLQREAIHTFVQAQRATMVTGDPFLWVVREISLLAEQHPVHILNLRPGSKSPHSHMSRYETYFTRIELMATYDQIGLFVKDLENRFPEAFIRSMDIAAGDSGHRVSLELVLLMQPQAVAEKPIAAVPAAAGKKS